MSNLVRMKGRITVEMAIVLPIIIFCIIIMIYGCILKYQELLIKTVVYAKTDVTNSSEYIDAVEPDKLKNTIKDEFEKKSIINYNNLIIADDLDNKYIKVKCRYILPFINIFKIKYYNIEVVSCLD